MRMTGMLLAAALLVASCGGGNAEQAAESPDPATTETTTETTTEPTTTEPPPAPDPDATYTHSCDYVLGDFTENPQTGYRFVADANIKNTGNIGVEVRATATWFLAGGSKATDEKDLKIEDGRSKRVGFTVPATSDQIDLHQSLTAGKTCDVRVSLVETFGQPS